MTNVTSINTSEGNVTIDQELFKGYAREAFEYLGDIEAADDKFKKVVETVAAATKLKKGKIAKYFRERFAAKTKATKELGQLFEKLDEVVEG